MNTESPLKDKVILMVDDEPDVLATLEEELDMCQIDKAMDYETALQYLRSYTYHIVILDIMGVNGFELLRYSVSRGFPTVMITAHALTAEALKRSIELGAVFFLPKEKLGELKSYLEDVVLGEGKPIWKKLLDRLGTYFEKRFGPDWIVKDRFLEEFINGLKKNMQE